MSWIDDRIADMKMLEDHQRELAERKRQISAQAETIYGDLWVEIKEVLKEFELKKLPAFINGSPLERLVRRSKVEPGAAYEIKISLTKDRQSISVSGEFSLHLQLDFCDDGVLCLKLAGEPISLRDTANKILDKFYFPELQPPPNKT